MIYGNTIHTTCQLSFKQYNLFYAVPKHEICPFMETVPYERHHIKSLNGNHELRIIILDFRR